MLRVDVDRNRLDRDLDSIVGQERRRKTITEATQVNGAIDAPPLATKRKTSMYFRD